LAIENGQDLNGFSPLNFGSQRSGISELFRFWKTPAPEWSTDDSFGVLAWRYALRAKRTIRIDPRIYHFFSQEKSTEESLGH
jgi:hypothetical protein